MHSYDRLNSGITLFVEATQTSFCQWNPYRDDTCHDFYLCSVSPASRGNRGKGNGNGNQCQPFGVFVPFTPATYVCIPSQKKIDRTLELIVPISSCGNDALVGVDVHDRTRRHGAQSAVALATDAPFKSRRRGPVICRKNSSMIRRPNSTGRIRNGKFAEVQGWGLSGETERNSCCAGSVVDVCQNKDCAERYSILFAFQPLPLAIRNAISLISHLCARRRLCSSMSCRDSCL
jgi:hypothetical protein